jgi:hypothetical protein
MEKLANIFKHEGRIDRFVLGIFILINGLVLLNSILHDPAIGYDAVDHLANIRAISSGHLPTVNESSEFFSPPLPYLLPAGLLASHLFTLEAAAKAGQLVNFLFSIGLTTTVLLTCEQISSSNRLLKIFGLTLTGFLPVYYKSFAMLRGEPYLAFWAVFSLYFALLAFSESPHLSHAIYLGLGLGFSMISRQWGFFLFPAIGLFALFRGLWYRSHALLYLRQLIIAVVLAFIIGGWFYIYLYNNYGTITAFNRDPARKFSLFNLQRAFYIGTGSGKLFSDPVRPSFPNQFFPVFYSEIWGDYWAYFTVYGQDKVTGDLVEGRRLETAVEKKSMPNLVTNRQTINSYLGRVNLVSLIPTVFFIGAFLVVTVSTFRKIRTREMPWVDQANLLFLFFVAFSLAGFGWFLIRYPDFNRGNTIKATYVLQVFPILSLLIAQPMVSLSRRYKAFFPASMIVLGLIFIHNLPSMITKYYR